ncbi:UNVERIFIED_CONTAM: hypothetical protein RMT77_000437 [Armadillidium vulgare]
MYYCPSKTLQIKTKRIGTNIFCSSLCSSDEGCGGFSVTENACKFYPFKIKPIESLEKQSGDVEIYVKNLEIRKDLLRGVSPDTEGQLPYHYQDVDVLTVSTSCWSEKTSCWCNRGYVNRGFSSLKIPMPVRYIIYEIIFNVPGDTNCDFTGVSIHVGDSGTESDPIFSDNLYRKPPGRVHLSVKGNQTGSFILLTQKKSDVYVICACSIEAYGKLAMNH